ncbi:MAG: hypothetical protein FWF91_04560 [Coriobacteriia bacterium]|nr:hypothetical protein [Coriobacteriia bacterium]
MFVDIVTVLNPRNIIENAITGTTITIAAIEMLGGTNDILCASRLMGRLLFLGSPDPDHELRLHELTMMDMPNLSELALTDIVSIRKSSEALATWRSDLSHALDYARRMRAAHNNPADIQQGVSEMMEYAREAICREARKSSLLSSGNLVAFLAGVLSGVGGSVVTGDALTMATGVAAGAIPAIAQAIVSNNPIPKYLDRHYIAFIKDR